MLIDLCVKHWLDLARLPVADTSNSIFDKRHTYDITLWWDMIPIIV